MNHVSVGGRGRGEGVGVGVSFISLEHLCSDPHSRPPRRLCGDGCWLVNGPIPLGGGGRREGGGLCLVAAVIFTAAASSGAKKLCVIVCAEASG